MISLEEARSIADALMNGFVVTASNVMIQCAYNRLVSTNTDWEGSQAHQRDWERAQFIWDYERD